MSATSALLTHPDGTSPIAAALEDAGYEVTAVDRPTVAVARLASGAFDCLVSVPELVAGDEPSLLAGVRELDATPPIVVYADGQEPVAEAAIDDGVDRVVGRNGTASLEQLVDAVDEVTTSVLEPQQDVSSHEPDPETLGSAIEEAPIGISLSDASLPDSPLVYVNERWQKITGYDEAAALGRNPRFLQGPDTDAATRNALATAIETGAPITTEIRNYRRDGTPFWNELTIAPVTDDGTITHYVGVQVDVTERKRRERTATERAEKLADERSALRAVIERVHGLLDEVTALIVAERDRRTIAENVCAEIVETEGYTGAWIGSQTASRETLELWGAAGPPAAIEPVQEVSALPEPIRAALDNETVDTCAVDECDGALAPAVAGAERLTVVPIAHERPSHALLCIYGADERALDHRHRQLFRSVGRMIATRLNAIDASETLVADQLVEIEVEIADSSFPLTQVARALETDVEYVGLAGQPTGDTAELIVTVETAMAAGDLTALPEVVDVRAISETNGGSTVAITVASSTPFVELGERGTSITAIEADPHQAVVRLELPPATDVRSILDLLESCYETVSLRTRHERDHRPRTRNECASVLESRLTDRQRTALEAAYLNGYFEWPRPTDGGEIAQTMDITRQTYHQHLRAAERKLVETFLET